MLFRRGKPIPIASADAVRQLSRADPRLGALIGRVGPFQLTLHRGEAFDLLGRAIANQQLTARAARAILERLNATLGAEGFPTPEAILEARDQLLRSTGFSGAKVAALKDLAAKTLDGTVPPLARLRSMDEEEIVRRLTAVRGVGRWTVEMLLIFRLGRPDVLPATDYGIQKGFARTFRSRTLPRPAELLRRGERWRPYRSVASWYLWRALELPE